MAQTKATKTQGTLVRIGQGDAASVDAGADNFLLIGEVMGVSGPGGSADVIDATSFDSTFKEKLMGLPDEGQITFRVVQVFDDAGQLEARAARKLQQLRNFRVKANTTQVPSQADFKGFVMSVQLEASPNSKWDATVTVEITGEVLWS